ncbi:MAG: hypothetical protein IJZ19_16050 [Lentisphaeria bacterium]|nr:hypothetical protein [Lentisphaeria bacterium]
MHFLTPPLPPAEKNLYCYFSADVPGGTTLKLYAKRFYEAWADGGFLGYGPAKSSEPLFYFDEYRLPPKKSIRLAVKVHDRNAPPQLWAELLADDGTVCPITWHCQWAAAYAADAPDTVGFVGFSEYYDAGCGENNWFEQTFSTTPVPGEEFPAEWLQKRTVPMPHFEIKTAQNISAERSDFGEFVYGRFIIKGNAVQAATFEIRYIEDLKHGWANVEGKPFMYADKVTVPAGNFEFKTFNKRGCRYIEIHGGKIENLSVSVESAGYPQKHQAYFHSSDERLNAIWELSRKTVELCTDDILNDCPHRDQAQWMDAFVTSQCHLAMNGTADMAAKAIIQHAVCSFKDGKFFSPSLGGRNYFADYALVELLFIRWYSQISGDTELVRKLLPNAETALRYFDRSKAPDHLLYDLPPEAFVYLDNAFELCKIGRSAGLNALYCGALKALAELKKSIGEDAAYYEAEAAAAEKTFHKLFDHPGYPGCLKDSADRHEQTFQHLCFSCELDNQWVGDGARAEFILFNDAEKPTALSSNDAEVFYEYMLVFGTYGPCRVYLNGELLFNGKRSGYWGNPAPCYKPEKLILNLPPGENRVTFDVKFVPANWELFFDIEKFRPESCTVCHLRYDDAFETSPRRQTSPRLWMPPALSQTTHGYAGFCGLLDNRFAEPLTPAEYPRNYMSVRVPLFSTEHAEGAVPGWVLPANTPWTQYFFLSALFNAGAGKRALEMLQKAWGVFLDNGAVNTWEEWNFNSSLCHGWGGVPVHFMAHDILGVHHETFAEKGYIEIIPDLCGLEHASGKVALGNDSWAEIALHFKDGKTEVKINVTGSQKVHIDLSKLPSPELSDI